MRARPLNPPFPVLGPSNLLRHTVSWPENFLMTVCPNFMDVVVPGFCSAPAAGPDRVAHTLADAQEMGLDNMPPVETCISSFVESPDEVLKQNI